MGILDNDLNQTMLTCVCLLFTLPFPSDLDIRAALPEEQQPGQDFTVGYDMLISDQYAQAVLVFKFKMEFYDWARQPVYGLIYSIAFSILYYILTTRNVHIFLCLRSDPLSENYRSIFSTTSAHGDIHLFGQYTPVGGSHRRVVLGVTQSGSVGEFTWR